MQSLIESIEISLNQKIEEKFLNDLELYLKTEKIKYFIIHLYKEEIKVTENIKEIRGKYFLITKMRGKVDLKNPFLDIKINFLNSDCEKENLRTLGVENNIYQNSNLQRQPSILSFFAQESNALTNQKKGLSFANSFLNQTLNEIFSLKFDASSSTKRLLSLLSDSKLNEKVSQEEILRKIMSFSKTYMEDFWSKINVFQTNETNQTVHLIKIKRVLETLKMKNPQKEEGEFFVKSIKRLSTLIVQRSMFKR
jgi:hypothetical protein